MIRILDGIIKQRTGSSNRDYELRNVQLDSGPVPRSLIISLIPYDPLVCFADAPLDRRHFCFMRLHTYFIEVRWFCI